MYATVDLYRKRNSGAREETREIDSILSRILPYIASGSNVMEREQEVTLEDTFRDLRFKWVNETFQYSDMYMAVTHPAHKALVDIGMPIVPYMIRDMASRETHWFLALYEITGENPIKPEHRGRVDLMVQDWVKWGREHNLL